MQLKKSVNIWNLLLILQIVICCPKVTYHFYFFVCVLRYNWVYYIWAYNIINVYSAADTCYWKERTRVEPKFGQSHGMTYFKRVLASGCSFYSRTLVREERRFSLDISEAYFSKFLCKFPIAFNALGYHSRSYIRILYNESTLCRNFHHVLLVGKQEFSF